MAERVESTQPSFMRALCSGEIEENLIYPYPELGDAQRETLRDVVSSVDALLAPHATDFRRWDHAGELPQAFIEELRARLAAEG